jgi:uncharacterized protein YkwD
MTVLRNLSLLAPVLVLFACAPAPRRPAEPAKLPVPGKPPAHAPTEPAKSRAPTSATLNGTEQKVIESTNAFRRGNGLDALKPNVRLIVIAQNHARNMARQDKFGDSDKNGHVLDGKSMEYRIKTGGYEFARTAENVGYENVRSDPAAAMMEDWKTSPGHRRNMLLPDVTEIGVGAALGKSGRRYFVQLFGRPPDPPQTTRAPKWRALRLPQGTAICASAARIGGGSGAGRRLARST